MGHHMAALACFLILSVSAIGTSAYSVLEGGIAHQVRTAQGSLLVSDGPFSFRQPPCTLTVLSCGMRMELYEDALLTSLGRGGSRGSERGTDAAADRPEHLFNWHLNPTPDLTGIALSPEIRLKSVAGDLQTASLPQVRPTGIAPVPEPTTLLLLGSTLCGIAIWLRKRKP